MANPFYSFNYLPLVSGSEGQDSFYSFNSCSRETLIRMAKSVSIRVHPCAKAKIIRMVNSFYSFNYFPLVSGSTTNLVFKKTHPHGKSVFICAICGRIKYPSAW